MQQNHNIRTHFTNCPTFSMSNNYPSSTNSSVNSLNNKMQNFNFEQNIIRQNIIRQNDIRQNDIRQNDIRQNDIRQNYNPQNVIRQNVIPQNDIRQNVIPQNDIPQNDIRQNDIRQNDIPQNDIRQNDIPQNDNPQNDIRQNDIRQNDIPQKDNDITMIEHNNNIQNVIVQNTQNNNNNKNNDVTMQNNNTQTIENNNNNNTQTTQNNNNNNKNNDVTMQNKDNTQSTENNNNNNNNNNDITMKNNDNTQTTENNNNTPTNIKRTRVLRRKQIESNVDKMNENELDLQIQVLNKNYKLDPTESINKLKQVLSLKKQNLTKILNTIKFEIENGVTKPVIKHIKIQFTPPLKIIDSRSVILMYTTLAAFSNKPILPNKKLFITYLSVIHKYYMAITNLEKEMKENIDYSDSLKTAFNTLILLRMIDKNNPLFDIKRLKDKAMKYLF